MAGGRFREAPSAMVDPTDCRRKSGRLVASAGHRSGLAAPPAKKITKNPEPFEANRVYTESMPGLDFRHPSKSMGGNFHGSVFSRCAPARSEACHAFLQDSTARSVGGRPFGPLGRRRGRIPRKQVCPALWVPLHAMGTGLRRLRGNSDVAVGAVSAYRDVAAAAGEYAAPRRDASQLAVFRPALSSPRGAAARVDPIPEMWRIRGLTLDSRRITAPPPE